MRRLDSARAVAWAGWTRRRGLFWSFTGPTIADHKAGVFDGEQFNKLFSLKVLERSNEKSDKAKAQAASARSERDAEHQARRDAFAGGRASTSGRSLKTFGRAVRRVLATANRALNFCPSAEILRHWTPPTSARPSFFA